MKKFFKLTMVSLTLAYSTQGLAGSYVGRVINLEVWDTGNVAFSMNPAIPTCNGQVIINKSSAGAKALIAAVMSAKALNKPVRVNSTGCIPADGYGGSYNRSTYIYLD
jgi:hypothetical protein